MITSITPEQEEKLAEYRDKWLSIGLCTDPIDKKSAKTDVINIATQILKQEEPIVLFEDSPYSAWLTVQAISLADGITKEDLPELLKNKENVKSKINFVYPYSSGQAWAGWSSLYDYMESVLGCDINPIWKIWAKISFVGPTWFLDKFCIVSDRPKEVHLKDGILHRDGGPAICYRDNFSVWCLNGIRVSQELSETPTRQLDVIKHVIKTQNVEVRREAVRKIGVERIYSELGGKILDQKDDYELVELDIGDGRKRPYLKMKNPSLGIWHLEGIHPDINTVDKAIQWRNQSDQKPIMLT